MRKTITSIYGLFRHGLVDYNIRRLSERSPLRVVVGASGVYQGGWIPTDIEHLNVLKVECWQRYFRESSIDAILAEHVWEHLEIEDGHTAARNCHRYLKPMGYLRVAVPDGFHPSGDYIDQVKPGGFGAGSSDHRVLYNYRTLSEIFEESGYQVDLLEYFDENHLFRFRDWDPGKGMITRSMRYDERNKDGELNYTSIILDAKKYA